MTTEDLQDLLAGNTFAPWVRQLGLRLRERRDDALLLTLPVTQLHVHGGGVLCGQTLMSAADTAMVLAIASKLGGFKPMTTVQLQTSFLRPIAADSGEAHITARVLHLGKSLAFGEVEIADSAGRLAAHATTTYAML